MKIQMGVMRGVQRGLVHFLLRYHSEGAIFLARCNNEETLTS